MNRGSSMLEFFLAFLLFLTSDLVSGGGDGDSPPAAKAEARGAAISAIEYIASAKSLIANLLIRLSRCLWVFRQNWTPSYTGACYVNTRRNGTFPGQIVFLASR